MRIDELQLAGLTVLQLTSRTLHDDPASAMALVGRALAPRRPGPV